MTRDEQEMALWTAEYVAARGVSAASASCAADEAVAEFRKRYPAEPAAPEPTAPGLTWYDEPPFEKDGDIYYCWVEGSTVPQSIYWSGDREAWMYFCNRTPMYPLAGRRVSPITKPQDPPQ